MKNQANDDNAPISTRSLVPRTPARPLARASEHARRRQAAKAATLLSSDLQAGSAIDQDARSTSPLLHLRPGHDQASLTAPMSLSTADGVFVLDSPPPTDPTDPDPTQK